MLKVVAASVVASHLACASSQASTPKPSQNQAAEWAVNPVPAPPPSAPLVAPAADTSPSIVAQGPAATWSGAEQASPPASDVTPDPWPKSAIVNGTKYTVYQPQLDSWNDYVYQAHGAVSVLAADSKAPIFGVIEISAVTIVDKQARVVHFENVLVTKATFPSVPQMAWTYQQAIQSVLNQGPATMSLGRLEAAVAIEGAQRKARQVPVLNEPPRIVFSTSAMVLVLIHGNPVWRQVSGTSLSRVLNTRALVLSDQSGNVYVHVLDGFLTAPSLMDRGRSRSRSPLRRTSWHKRWHNKTLSTSCKGR